MVAEFATEVVDVEDAALILLAERHLRHVGCEQPPALPHVAVVEVALGVGGVMLTRLDVGAVENRVVVFGHGCLERSGTGAGWGGL